MTPLGIGDLGLEPVRRSDRHDGVPHVAQPGICADGSSFSIRCRHHWGIRGRYDDGTVGRCARYPGTFEVTGRRDGWTNLMGTLEPYRGRGIASALMTHGLRALAAEGLTRAALNVDADSPTGADRPYRRLGFEPIMRWVAYQIEVP